MGGLDLGNNNKGGIFGSLGRYLEKSTIIDLATIIVLGMNFFLLQEHIGFGDSLFEFSTDSTVLAAQATGLMMLIYLAETIADKSR